MTFGQPIGTLPTAVRPRAYFRGWLIHGESINEETPYAVPGNSTATANWDLQFGGVTDYFGLASSALVPVSSTTGDTRHRVAVSHSGKYESGVNEIGGIWRNPSVTYVVKANTTVIVQLGKAWAATFTGSGSSRKMTVSGYMITTVEIVTEFGKFPTVTVSAVANEGANAVNNFTENKNKFNVSVPVVARSKAQNLLGAISGGGYLQRCSLVATCDPVVCEENLMPFASDIVNGRYELSAETLAANAEAAPTMNGVFALIDDPRQTRESDYIRYTIEARKEMSKMGYYTGSGTTTNGGSTVSLRSSGPAVGGAYYTYQRTKTTVNVKNGVSLKTAQAAAGDMNLNYWQWPGGLVEPACRGTRSSTAYAQIDGSNLYALTTTIETIQVRGKQGTYDSGWVS